MCNILIEKQRFHLTVKSLFFITCLLLSLSVPENNFPCPQGILYHNDSLVGRSLKP